MKKLIINLVVLFGMVTSSWANSYYALSIKGAERTLTYSHSDWTAAVLSWNINDKTAPDYWTYDYVWSAGNKDPRHSDTEGPLTLTGDSLISRKSYGATLVEFDGPGALNTKYGSIFGLEWDLGGGITSIHLTLVSTRAPMWGNSPAKGGLPGVTYAKNPTFEMVSSDSMGRGSNGWALVPDTVVPIPSALWLLGPAFIGIVGLRRKFNK